MKIVIIHGQSHHGVSYHIGRELVNKMENQNNITEFFLPRDMPMFCLGCYNCMNKGEEYCPHYTYTKPILEAIDQADLLVFTTPVYCMHVTGSMKVFLDHCFTRWIVHRPHSSMYFKKAIIISVGAGAGMKQAAKDIKTSLFYWGISNIEIYKQRSGATSWQSVSTDKKNKIDKDLMKLIAKIQHHSKNKVSLKSKIMFKIMKIMQKKGWSASIMDYEYWQKQGWLGKVKPWNKNE